MKKIINDMPRVKSPAINPPNKQKHNKLLIYIALKSNINRRPKIKKVDITVNLFLKVARRGIEPLLPE
jgi:hypothetical protein